MARKFIVTGKNGFLGSRIVEYLDGDCKAHGNIAKNFERVCEEIKSGSFDLLINTSGPSKLHLNWENIEYETNAAIRRYKILNTLGINSIHFSSIHRINTESPYGAYHSRLFDEIKNLKNIHTVTLPNCIGYFDSGPSNKLLFSELLQSLKLRKPVVLNNPKLKFCGIPVMVMIECLLTNLCNDVLEFEILPNIDCTVDDFTNLVTRLYENNEVLIDNNELNHLKFEIDRFKSIYD